MKNVNMAVVAGRLVKDPELKATTGGSSVLEFSVAFNTSKRSQTGEWEDEANYIDCVLFGNRAESLSRFLHKGMKVTVLGALKQQRWQGRDGQNRSRIVLNANEVELPDRQQQQEQPTYAAPQPAPQQLPMDTGLYDEEIPF